MSAKGKKEDAPSGEKGVRLTKGRNSFRFGKNKSASVSRSSGVSGKTVQVKGRSCVEELEKKQGEVFRLLECSEDAVRKNIPAYLMGLPSMVLENVISLTREIDQMAPHTNSSEMSSLMSHVNQTVAEHGLWIDNFFLYGDKFHSDQSINTIVHNVREAVKSLVEFAINKENQNISDPNYFYSCGSNRNESNNSCSGDSPYSRKKLNETRNSHAHGSMPEIPSATSGLSGGSLTRKTPPPPKILTHSFSSDSILENKGKSSPPTNPSVCAADCEGTSSCDESTAPPIPPKKNIKGRNSLRSSYESESSLRRNSPYDSSFDEAENISTRPSSAVLITSSSTPQSLDRSHNYSMNHSSATSHDSILQHSPHLNHSGTDRNTSRGSNSSGSIDLNPRISDFTSVVSHNCETSSSRRYFSDHQSSASSCTSSTTNTSSRIYYNHHYLAMKHKEKSVTDSDKETTSQFSNVSSSQQHLILHRSSRNSGCSSSSRSSGSETEINAIALSVPPPIPKKWRHQLNCHSTDRAFSQYDNIDGIPASDKVDSKHHSDPTESFGLRHKFSSTQDENSIVYSANSSTSELASSKSSVASWESTTSSSSPASTSVIRRRYNETYRNHTNRTRSSSDKPPLPLKQRHIMEYMQTFKDYEMPESEWFQNRLLHQDPNSYQTSIANLSDEFREPKMDSPFNTRLSLPNTSSYHQPPALPPKRKSRSPDFHQSGSSDSASKESFAPDASESWQAPELCPCQRKESPLIPSDLVQNSASAVDTNIRTKNVQDTETSGRENNETKEKVVEEPAEFVEAEEDSLLDCLNVNEHIVFQYPAKDSEGKTGTADEAAAKSGSSVPLIDKTASVDDLLVKAGSVDALVVYATYTKNGTYLEAFLTTYRTFLSPSELISKLFYRYNKFVCRSSNEYQKAAKNAFSLLVRVVHDLVVPELTEELLKELSQFEYNLLAKGDLKLALYFRKKLSEKLELRKNYQEQVELPYHHVTTKNEHQYTFLDFKGSDIADQMTLLDSELFSKFGIPELLYYFRDQNEEFCPNLAIFAMQINKMSSWVKTLILKSNSQDREKYYKKFIKIMKHLRKVNNNFNSCIAILSGLESPDVRRLDWPRASSDLLKEYCDLFDFKYSYQTYRHALADTRPPCIPHLGIVLQDLTKLYEVSPNFVDGKVNFQKRWVQFGILENMKRFIPSKYNIPKNEAIRNFINNYEDCMGDEELWELSLSIKPQKTKPKRDVNK